MHKIYEFYIYSSCFYIDPSIGFLLMYCFTPLCGEVIYYLPVLALLIDPLHRYLLQHNSYYSQTHINRLAISISTNLFALSALYCSVTD